MYKTRLHDLLGVLFQSFYKKDKKKKQKDVAESTGFRVRPDPQYICFLHSVLFSAYLLYSHLSCLPSSFFLSSFHKYLLSFIIFINYTSFLFKPLLVSALSPSTCFILSCTQKSLKFSTWNMMALTFQDPLKTKTTEPMPACVVLSAGLSAFY